LHLVGFIIRISVAGKKVRTLQWKAVVSKGLRGWCDSQKFVKLKCFQRKILNYLSTW